MEDKSGGEKEPNNLSIDEDFHGFGEETVFPLPIQIIEGEYDVTVSREKKKGEANQRSGTCENSKAYCDRAQKEQNGSK